MSFHQENSAGDVSSGFVTGKVSEIVSK